VYVAEAPLPTFALIHSAGGIPGLIMVAPNTVISASANHAGALIAVSVAVSTPMVITLLPSSGIVTAPHPRLVTALPTLFTISGAASPGSVDILAANGATVTKSWS